MMSPYEFIPVSPRFGFDCLAGVKSNHDILLLLLLLRRRRLLLPLSSSLSFLLFFPTFYNCIVPIGFLSCEIQVAFPGKSQLRQSRATQPKVHVGCFIVSIIHPTLTWTTGSYNVCTDVNACDCTQGCTDTVRESALKVDSGRIIPRRTVESNLRRWRACPMLYQLSYIPTPK